jgi:16S rRNA (guanine527-N7)-methyltransferase
MALEPEGRGFHPRIERVLGALAGPGAVDAALVAKLGQLCDLIAVWSAKLDLTAARSAEELVDLVVADAALVSRHQAAGTDARWVDVGSGAGAPGLVLALLMPGTRFTLVEPKQKRVAFLRTALGSLGLDAAVRRSRSSDVAPGAHDVSISRATLGPEAWLAEGTRLATAACWVLLARAEPPQISGWHSDLDLKYVWPLTGVQRRALRYVPERTT